MAATGTIALNANSLTVSGSGTKFTTEAQVGGALVTYIGNVPYTFVVGAINSDTSITLTANYQGTNVSGQSFSLIDRGAYTAITAELGARTAQAIRGLNYDKSNWQQVLTGSGNVTVNVPDGSQYTG
ncbi:tail fiber, partial [bacteria symbiont BFo2 of Frankliniella occidentalis]